MSLRLEKAQAIRLKPNNESCFAVSMPIHYGAALFAFSCDNLIYIYNRSDFSEKIIETPDPTSSIKLITFAYNIKRDYFIFCAKDNKKIYQIAMNDFSVIHTYNKIGNSIPYSLTSCINRIFYLSENNLYSFYFLEEKVSLIAKNISYKEVVSSPNGSAVALFTKGEKDIKILYYPFKNDIFNFTFDSPLVDFQWDCSHYLAAVTACEDKSVKVWLQQSNALEMYCIGSYTFSDPITTIAFSHDFNDAEFIGTFDNSVGNTAEPSLKRPKAQILVTTTKSMILCEETSANTLSQIMSSSLPFPDPIATNCYLFRIYSNGEIEQRFDITFFTKKGLFFHQLELTSKEYIQLTPFQIKFLTNPISKIINYSEHLITESDNIFYDWFSDAEITNLTYDIGQYKGEINKLTESIENEKKSFKDMMICDMKSENDQLLIFLSKGNFGGFDIYQKNHHIYEISADDEITSATIHSQNIFAICTKSEVICYIRENDTYKVFSKLKANRPIARFLPNTYLLISVSSDDSLSFYSIKYKEFVLITRKMTVPIVDFTYKGEMNSIIISTENSLFFYDFDIDLPRIHLIDDDFVFLTSLTLCMFSVLSKREKGEKVTLSDFVTKDDSYILPTKYQSNLPPQFEPFCSLKAPGWETLSDNGRRFIFSYNFARFYDQKLIPFFSIWAFLSRDQHLFVSPLNFQNSIEILTSYSPLWVKEDRVLSSFVIQIVNKTYPSEEEFDLYLLLCVLVNKYSIASKVALKHGNKKIAKHLNSEKEMNLSKVEKSAFEALKCHRYELASLFFIVMKRNDQALHVIKENPMLSLLVARLLNEKEKVRSILDSNDFFASKETDSINRFFHVFNEDKNEAVDILINYKLPDCDLICLDAHRCEMINEIDKDVPKSILLNLQFVPYFIKKFYMQKISIPSKKLHHHQQKEKQPKTTTVNETAQFEFDFGGIENLDLIDIEEYEEEENNENDDGENVVVNENNRSALIDDSNFSNSFDLDLFKTNPNVVFTTNEIFIASQINKLFNVQFDQRTVKSLTSITRLISDRAIISAILFAMSFALSKSSMIIPLLNSFDFKLENYFDEFETCEVEVKPPDLLTRFANQSTEINENDINIVNCLAFNKMATNLSKSNNFTNLKELAHYFHHRHRILFKKINFFFFSNEGLIDDIDPLQLDPIQNLEKMEKVSLHEKWLIAFNSSFSTPFFMDNKFNFTRSLVVKTGIDGPIRGICIDQQHNQKIAICSESFNTLKITNEELNGKYIVGSSEEEKYLYFDSPFAPLLNPHENDQQKSSIDYKFDCKWSKGRYLKTFLKTTACCSHPKCEIYVTGELNGNLKMWRFSSKIPRSIHSASFIESPIKTIEFNELGNKLLITNKDGNVYLSDLVENDDLISSICSREKSTATWFNESNQIAVVHPKESLLCLYDTRVSPSTLSTSALSTSSSISIEDSKASISTNSSSESPMKSISMNPIESSTKSIYMKPFESPTKSISIGSSLNNKPFKIKSKSTSILNKYQTLDDLNQLKPVITYNLSSSFDKRCPISAWEQRVAVGNTEGKILLFDIRNERPLNKRLHKGRVTALKFHPSGKFVVSGGMDNSVIFSDPNDFYRSSEIISNVLAPDSYDKKTGIKEIAVSRQSIVVGGFSRVLQVWTVENEQMKGFKKSLSSAIDLRNISYVNNEESFSD